MATRTRKPKVKFEETSVVDKIEILIDDSIQVRTRNQILKNGEEVSCTFHRHVLYKGDDLSSQDLRVQRIATALWNL